MKKKNRRPNILTFNFELIFHKNIKYIDFKGKFEEKLMNNVS